MMVLIANLPSIPLLLTSVYRPMAQVHAANDGPLVRRYKQMTGISRDAHKDGICGPWEHSCQDMNLASHLLQAVVARQWVRQGAGSKEDFRESHAYTLQPDQALSGACFAAYPRTVHSPSGLPSPHHCVAAGGG